MGTGLRVVAAACAAAVLAVSAWRVVDTSVRAINGGSAVDFIALATGAHLAHDHAPLYELSAQADAQAGVIGYRPEHATGFPVPYVDPPAGAWLAQPVALFPFETALRIVVLLGLLSLAVSVVVFARAFRAPIPTWAKAAIAAGALLSLPATVGIELGQTDQFLVLPALLGVLALQRDRPLLAGLLLSTLWMKPQLIWLVLPVVLVARHWRVFAGLMAGGLAWVASSLALAGPGQIGEWLALIRRPEFTHLAVESKSVPGVLGAAFDSAGIATAVSVVLAIGVVAFAWSRRDVLHADPMAALALGVIASLACAPHLFPYDLVMVAVAAAAWSHRSTSQAVAAVAAVDLAWLADQASRGAAHAQAMVVGLLLAGVMQRVAAVPSGGPLSLRSGGRILAQPAGPRPIVLTLDGPSRDARSWRNGDGRRTGR